MKRIILYLCMFFCFSCTSNTDRAVVVFDDITHAPVIVAETLFEVGSDDIFFFGNIADVKVLSEGKIAVLDSRSLAIHLLSEKGEVIKSVPLEGRGPGEVQNLSNRIRITPDDYLAVRDFLMFKISIFQAIDEELLHVTDVVLEHSVGNFFMNGKDQLILKKSTPAGSTDIQEPIVTMDVNGSNSFKTVREFPPFEQLKLTGSVGGMNFTIGNSTKYHARNEFCFNNGLLYHVRTDSVGFAAYRINDGEKVSSVYQDLPIVRLSKEEKEKKIDELLASGSEFWGESEKRRLMSEMPEFKPQVKTVICDLPNGIWMELLGDSEEYSEWLLLSEAGEIKGLFQKEMDGSVVSIHKGKIFVSETNDVGDITLRVYRYFISQN